MEEDEILGGNEFVFTRKVGADGEAEFIGGGYKVNSYFLKAGSSPIKTINHEYKQNGGKVSSPFENLAIPAGIFYINQRVKKLDSENNNNHYKKHEMLPDEIFDKLFGLVEFDKKRKRKTRKFIKKVKHTNNKTHKQK